MCVCVCVPPNQTFFPAYASFIIQTMKWFIYVSYINVLLYNLNLLYNVNVLFLNRVLFRAFVQLIYSWAELLRVTFIVIYHIKHWASGSSIIINIIWFLITHDTSAHCHHQIYVIVLFYVNEITNWKMYVVVLFHSDGITDWKMYVIVLLYVNGITEETYWYASLPVNMFVRV